MRKFRIAMSSALIAASLAPAPLFGATAVFDPQFIMSDAEIRDASAMSQADVSLFLARRGGLADVSDIDPIDGVTKPAAQLIYDAAQRYRINPEYVLALLQKESSVVETSVPTQSQLDWAAGYALCDGCYKGIEAARVGCPTEPDPAECLRKAEIAQKYKGFAKQVDAGAGWMDWFLTGAGGLPGYNKPGQPYVVSGTTIVPANMVTAGLYNYTPHLHGNQLLWSLMQRWFGLGSPKPFPDGTLVRNKKNGAVAVIQNAKFRPILKKSILLTRYRSANIVDLDEREFAALEKSDRGAPVRFSDLSLVRTETGATYLLIGNTKRPIPTPAAFSALGFNPEEVETVAAADIEEYYVGEPILPEAAFPLGELVQDTRTGGVYYAESGVKRPLIDKAVLTVNFPGRKILPGKGDTLAKLTPGAPLGFPDGTLLKAAGQPTVYLVSGGKKRAFPTERDFKTLGFSFAKVVTTTASALELHATGEPISLGLPEEQVQPAVQ